MKFKFLKEGQVFGKNKLKIFNDYSIEADSTDFTLLLGGSNTNYVNGVAQNYNISLWWTQTFDDKGISCVKTDDVILKAIADGRSVGARPSFNYSKVEEEKMFYYGEYPQTIVGSSFSSVLEEAYKNKKINTTGKTYTTDWVDISNYDESFVARVHNEYEYGGKKYIRFVSGYTSNFQELSDGRKIIKNDVYWILVEPIKWIVDKDSGIAFSEKLLFSGIQFNNKRNCVTNFKDTDISKYMNKYFVKDIIPSFVHTVDMISDDEYKNVIKEYLFLLYTKSKEIFDILSGTSNLEVMKLIVLVNNILDAVELNFDLIYESVGTSRNDVVEYLTTQLNNLDMIKCDASNLRFSHWGFYEYVEKPEKITSKIKLRKL